MADASLASAPATLTAKKPTPIPNISGVGGGATDPSNDLRGQTLAVAPTANRADLATDYLNTWDQATTPQFQADQRSLTSNAAATGRLGSGGFRTSLGDLSYNRDLQRNAQAKNFYTDALNGSIDDAYKNVGIAQQQQGFQTALQNQTFNQDMASRQQQNSEYNDLFNQNFATNSYNDSRGDTAFNQDVTSKQLANATQAQQFGQGVTTRQLDQSQYDDLFNQNFATNAYNDSRSDNAFNQDVTSQQLANSTQGQQFNQQSQLAQLLDQFTNSAHTRNLQDYTVGSAGDPSSAYLGLAGLYGGQGQEGANNLSSLIGNTVAKNGAQSQQDAITALLQQYGLLGGGTATPKTPAATTAPDITTGGGYS